MNLRMLTNSSSLLQAGAGRRVYCTGSGRGPCGWQAPCDATLHVQPQPSRVRGGYATPPPPAPRPHVHSLSPVGAGGDVAVHVPAGDANAHQLDQVADCGVHAADAA